MSKVVAAAVAGAITLTTAGGLTVAKVLDRDDVTISLDGVAQQVKVKPGTVAQALESQGVKVGPHDSVQPELNTKVADGTLIAVSYGRKIGLDVDGHDSTRWTTARTVAEVLQQLSLDNPKNIVSVSRSAGISRQGLDLSVETAKSVTVKAQGKTYDVTTPGTVADALRVAGIRYDTNDISSPGLGSALTNGMAIVWTKVDIKSTTRDVTVDFGKKSVNSSSLTEGDTEITTKGVDGVNRQTWVMTYHDGKLVSKKLTATTKVKAPVTQITEVGTKAPVATSSSSPSSSSSSSSSDSGSGSSDSPVSGGSTCEASTYGADDGTAGGPTASGETFDPSQLTAASKTLPLGSTIRVTNVANGQTVSVRINDRGPYVDGRCLDLSTAAMNAIAPGEGLITVRYGS